VICSHAVDFNVYFSVMSADHVRQVQPKPGDKLLGFIASVRCDFVLLASSVHENCVIFSAGSVVASSVHGIW